MDFRLIRIFSVAAFVIMATPTLAATRNASRKSHFTSAIAAVERASGGRLGVAVLDTATGKQLGYRTKERFALCSTFKLLLAADVLSRVDSKQEKPDRAIKYTASDLLDYAPITRKHLLKGEMSVYELCAAALEYSDNTAADLLLKTVGGPPGLTRYLRTLGDKVTRLDRTEPTLNTNLPGDLRDTTTPTAMAATMRKILVGNTLSAASKRQLINWLMNCKTGDAKLRAGLGPTWKVGDKTGLGDRGASNDAAIAWPPKSAPILIAVYYSGSAASDAKKSAVIAKVGSIIAATFHPNSKRVVSDGRRLHNRK